jgi:hypothetical protein
MIVRIDSMYFWAKLESHNGNDSRHVFNAVQEHLKETGLQ